MGVFLEPEPTPVNVPRVQYVVSADTATSKDTHLTWQRRAASEHMTWDEARSHCSRLSLGRVTGWRLPTKDELRTIVDNRAGPPAIDRVVFPNTPGEWFWSSSPYDNADGVAWAVSFIDGETSFGAVGGRFLVRCVR